MAAKKPRNNITGNRFGRLVATGFKHFNDKKQDCWLFKCDCGNEKIMPSAHVKWGRVRSCGCLAKEHIESLKKKDITGEKYGRLIAICPTTRRDATGSVIWECRCDCGNKVFYSVNNLSQGKTKSCGCLYLETRGICSGKRMDLVEDTLVSLLVASKETRSDNCSGHTGVCYDKRRGNWMAYINVQRKRIYLGAFSVKEDAIKARKNAEAQLHDPIILENWNKLSDSGKVKWTSYANNKV